MRSRNHSGVLIKLQSKEGTANKISDQFPVRGVVDVLIPHRHFENSDIVGERLFLGAFR